PAESRDALARHPSELLRLLPYAAQLERRQTGLDYQGLDSGFGHLNNICDGLNTGLFILAAPPAVGKTTLTWQICCQAADLNRVPVIFISLEQSAEELRAKALARLAGVEYRHLLRGRLQAGDVENWPKVLEALSRYAQFAPYLTIVEGDTATTISAIR